jgi:hypothetical protein
MKKELRIKYGKIAHIMYDQDLVRRYEAHEREVLDFNSSISYAKKEGFAIGLSQTGVSVAKIAEITGLPVKEIEWILKKNEDVEEL